MVFERDKSVSLDKLTPFDRKLVDASGIFTYIGSGSIGGKAQGLAFLKEALVSRIDHETFPGISVTIPTLTVLTTDIFDHFMSQNKLYDIALADLRDEQIASAFLRAELPPDVVGDIRIISQKYHTPLAIRSSSMFEDAMHEPFAGVYGTKMIPNNQHDPDARFRVLLEAIKFVYASTFFKEAKEYIATTGQSVENEKMAVIIQEVVGLRFGDLFYPQVSGVARSYNFYRTGGAKPEEGIVNLALGLGKTIVDGGKSWNYSPANPRAIPPYKDLKDMLKATQTEFWAINMGKPPEYDPMQETEYLATGNIGAAEEHEVLTFLSSTLDVENERLIIGTTVPGPRILTFAPILDIGDIPLNDLIRHLLDLCEEVMGHQVEIEFAVTLDRERGLPARFGFLQVRPMFVSRNSVSVAENELTGPAVLAASEDVLGNGVINSISDIVYMRSGSFNERDSRIMASQLEKINHQLAAEGRPYLLLVYGRLGTTDPPFGIPVGWWQVSGAKVIVEMALPGGSTEMSQGSHFFHNVISSQVGYFSMPRSSKYAIKWEWLENQAVAGESEFIRHISLKTPLTVKIDGTSGRGVINYE
jgi:hypothetical protein